MRKIFISRLMALTLAALISNSLAQTPTNVTAQCGVGGNTVTLSWAAVSGAVAYAPRLNNVANDSSSCAYGWACSSGGDWFDNYYVSTSRIAGVVPGQPYSFWVHSLVNGNWSAPATINFTCAPTNTAQAIVNNLNAQIVSGNLTLDYLIQNVCVDASDRPIPGDPVTCGTSRNVRIGERVPYILTDFDTANNNTRYQGQFSYPVVGVDGLLKVLSLKQLIGAGRQTLDSGFQFSFDQRRDGYDLIDVNGSYVSAIRTSDGGCFDQKISQDSSTRANGWRFMPTTGSSPGSLVNHNIRFDRLVQPAQGLPLACQNANLVNGVYSPASSVTDNSVQSIWNPPVATTFESGKILNSIQTYHVAHYDLTLTNNAIEKYFFTREYGYSRWEAWIPQGRCFNENGASSPICFPNSSINNLRGRCNPNTGYANWGNQTWVRIDCRDATSYLALNTPALPLDNVVGQSNGLVDLNSESVFNAYELVLRGNQDFSHQVGFQNGNSWTGSVSTSGFLSYGPYTTSLPSKLLTADFRFISDSNAAPNVPVVNFDIFDATSGALLGTSLVSRQSLASANLEGSFKINFDMTGRQGHAIEFRSYVYGASNVRLNKVVIQPTP
jgi:hypothetical protein